MSKNFLLFLADALPLIQLRIEKKKMKMKMRKKKRNIKGLTKLPAKEQEGQMIHNALVHKAVV